MPPMLVWLLCDFPGLVRLAWKVHELFPLEHLLCPVSGCPQKRINSTLKQHDPKDGERSYFLIISIGSESLTAEKKHAYGCIRPPYGLIIPHSVHPVRQKCFGPTRFGSGFLQPHLDPARRSDLLRHQRPPSGLPPSILPVKTVGQLRSGFRCLRLVRLDSFQGRDPLPGRRFQLLP